jgi:O-Antigen ligase
MSSRVLSASDGGEAERPNAARRRPVETFILVLFTFGIFTWAINYEKIIGPAVFSVQAIGRWIFVVCILGCTAMLLSIPQNLWNRGAALLLSMGLLVPSLVWSGDQIQSWANFSRFLSEVSIILICFSVPSLIFFMPRVLRFTSNVIVFFSALWIVFCPDADVSQPLIEAGTRLNRQAGITGHYNLLGFFCAICVASFLSSENILEKRGLVTRWLILGIALFCSYKTDSRVTWLMMLTTLAFLVFWRARRTRAARKNGKVFILSLFLVILTLVSIPLYVAAAGWGDSLADNDDGYSQSNYERVIAWRKSLEIFGDHVCCGQGFGRIIPLGYETWDGVPVELGYSHNFVLNSLANSGLFGVSFGLVLLYLTTSILVETLPLRGMSAGGGEAAFDRSMLREMGFCAAIVINVLEFSATDGGLQGSHAVNIIFAIALGQLGVLTSIGHKYGSSIGYRTQNLVFHR